MDNIPDFIDLPDDNPSAKIALYSLFEQLLLLDQDEKIRALQFLTSTLDLKTIPEAMAVTGKSYNGIKKFGNTIRILNKTFVLLNK